MSTEDCKGSVDERSAQTRAREASIHGSECSTSAESRRWQDTGIEIGAADNKPSTSGQSESVPTIEMDFDEARRQYKKTYGKPGSKYEDLFGDSHESLSQ